MTGRTVPILALLLLGLTAAPAWGQALVADLTSHLIAITTGFVGTDVVLFGTIEGDGDVVVVVRGPDSSAVVRRKDRVAGIWLNRRQVTFQQVPGFYALASSAPIADIAPPETLERQHIGVDHLDLRPTEPVAAAELPEFRAALIRNKEREGLFPARVGPVHFIGPRLFRATLFFPSNVPVGTYQVQVYLVRNGQVAGAQTTPLLVSKLGVSAWVVELASRWALSYGMGSVLIAVAVGYLASQMLRP